MSKKSNGEGSIYKRKDGKYTGQITIGRDSTGKLIRKTVYGNTKTDVLKKLTQLQAKVFTGTYFEPSKLTLEQWLQSWFETYKEISLRPQTKELYCTLINKIINPRIGWMKLCEIKPIHIQDLVNRLHKEGYSSSTIQKIKNILNPAFKIAIVNKLIPESPIQNIQMPEKREKQIRAFTKAEQTKFIEAAKRSYFYEAYIIALNTGIRCGELLALNWDDIDFNNGEIKVNKTIITVKDASGKFVVQIQHMPKTQSSERTVPLPINCIKILKDLRKKRLSKNFNDNNIVFCSKVGTYVFPKNFRRSMDVVTSKAGIEKCGTHVLRHTYATRLFEAGVDIKTVSELLGHSKIEITLNIYTHVFKDDKKEAVQVLNQIMQLM